MNQSVFSWVYVSPPGFTFSLRTNSVKQQIEHFLKGAAGLFFFWRKRVVLKPTGGKNQRVSPGNSCDVNCFRKGV